MTPQHLDALVDSLKPEQTITELSVFYHCVLRENSRDPDEKVSAEAVKARLHHLVEQGKLKILYPAGVDPETAGRAQTYYLKMDEQA